jgi:hypothetical protein
MSMHVDLVKNEWLAGIQVRLVTVTSTGDHNSLVNVTPGWEDLLGRELTDRAGESVYVAKESLGVLPQLFQGEYVFATDPHDESDCPFQWGPVVAMTALPDTA